jgi:hypothetical protein
MAPAGRCTGWIPFASQAALFGVHVFVLHYFGRTGHYWIFPSQIESNFLTSWKQFSNSIEFPT